ncbi:MAG: lipid A export permease/ATP-binding protein MsbA [Gammaproteobacteria bacterium]|nr:lipid A export permease/ATP-binding protein MsbA [Gammaproteobacteria bacterium]
MKIAQIYNNESANIYKRLLASLKPYIGIFALGIVATILESLAGAGFVALIKPIIDRGFIAHDMKFIHWLPFIVVGIFFFKGILSFASNYYVNKVGRRVITDFRQRIFNHLLKLPASFYDKQTSGQLLSLMIYNVEQIAEATTFALLTVFQEGFLVIGFLCVMFMNSWQLSSLFLIATPLIAWIIRYTSKRMQLLSSNVQKAMGQVTHVAEEAIEGYKVIRTFGGEEYEKKKFYDTTELNQHREMKIIVTDTIGSSTVQLLAAIPISCILFLAALPSLKVSAGSFVAILGAMVSLLTPLRRLSRVNSTIQKGIAGAKSIFELLDVETEKDRGQISLTKARGEIEFRNVYFGYENNQKNVLNSISFHINPGETIALVGRSGSGKTSLVNLLPRFYEHNAGQICIDAIDVREYRLNDLRRQFAFVSQQVNLFNDTIANNIAYGIFENVTLERIKEAADAACALEFIQKLPDGFNTFIGENGVLLSGGQRQRIAIARALIKDAPILILDEATSALDNESERYIQIALEKLMQNRTTIIIAHRLSTIEKADRILVLEEGKIVETGTHQELLISNGYYTKLQSIHSTEASKEQYELI